MKITAIAPYAGLAEIINDVAAEKGITTIDVLVGDLQEGVRSAIQAEKQNCDIIISRGETAERIKKHVAIPVISIDVSGFDLLRVITLIKDTDSHAAFVGFPAIANAVKTISSLIDVHLDVYAINDELHIEQQLRKLKESHYTFVIGDVITVQLAEKTGLHGLLLTSGRESVLNAFIQAEDAYRMIAALKNERDTYREMIYNQHQHTVLVNGQATVLSHREFPLPMDYVEWLADAIATHGPLQFLMAYQHQLYELNGRQLLGRQVLIELQEQKDIPEALPLVTLISPANDAVYLSSNHHEVQQLIEHADALRDQAGPIILTGETGSGKESLARHIHGLSEGFFLKVDGSQCQVAFYDVLADILHQGGVLYIINAESLPDEALAWLKAHQQNPFRIILTADLETKGKLPVKGTLLHLPPLRERKQDIADLARLFISTFNSEFGRQIAGIRPEAMDLLENYAYPQNITELGRIMKEAVLEEETEYILDGTIETILSSMGPDTKVEIDLSGTFADIETQIIQAVWLEENKNRSKTAQRLGINRTTLWRKLKELD
ncbi:sigma-54-dependent transcriptional regulator [Aureibacillus halotolerans]|uniref:Sigma-54-interacting transcriptional regulator n=1 Tax=Aureibacillus halotolerans TaxID=1508390 RepID=A0A4R6U836_9BACI|nr:sigma-54-dependent transcriptional regulator [Aureibacillus halotolerans]TDQ41103.1 sigma-54-interacting transcriptional regulator [Aureibacillus halotolerans]